MNQQAAARLRANLRERWSQPHQLEDWWTRQLLAANRPKLHQLAQELGVTAADSGYERAQHLAQSWESSGQTNEDESRRQALSFGATVLQGVLFSLTDSLDNERFWQRLWAKTGADTAAQREAAALGIRLAARLSMERTLDQLEHESPHAGCAQHRAVLVALGSTFVLERVDGHRAERIWNLFTAALNLLQDTPRGSCESLRKVLGEAPSLLVVQQPPEGFEQLERWAEREATVARRVVASNLNKARLRRAFPDEVERVGMRLMDQ